MALPEGSGREPWFADAPFERILRWTPDQNKHCQSLAHASGGEVERQFGVHPLMLSCWTCLVGKLNPEQIDGLMRATDWPSIPH
jgi:hypothetical protein